MPTFFSERRSTSPSDLKPTGMDAAVFRGLDSVDLYTSDGHIRTLVEIEADVIRLATKHYRGQMAEVAGRLGIGRSPLYRKVAELGFEDS